MDNIIKNNFENSQSETPFDLSIEEFGVIELIALLEAKPLDTKKLANFLRREPHVFVSLMLGGKIDNIKKKQMEGLLYGVYKKDVESTILKTGGPLLYEDLADIEQEVWKNIFFYIGQCDKSLVGWINRLTFAKTLNYLNLSNYKNSKNTHSLDNPSEFDSSKDTHLGSLPSPMIDYLAMQGTYSDITAAFNNISDLNLRKTFYLRVIEDVTYEQIAENMSVSIGTVKSRISRARQQASKYLIKVGYAPDGVL
jgi:DNA-directed RNA polymerase specialized sigma24 family protein